VSEIFYRAVVRKKRRRSRRRKNCAVSEARNDRLVDGRCSLVISITKVCLGTIVQRCINHFDVYVGLGKNVVGESDIPVGLPCVSKEGGINLRYRTWIQLLAGSIMKELDVVGRHQFVNRWEGSEYVENHVLEAKEISQMCEMEEFIEHRQRRIGSSKIYILDTKPDPKQPKIVKVIEPEEFIQKTGYTSPHTIHCGPDGVYESALGSASGDGPGGIFLMDANTFELKGQWEQDRGPQQLAYDFWWHLGHDTMITSEWGTPNMVKDGVNPELLLAGKYGHKIHIWDLDKRRHQQEIDLGAEQQWVLELRPSHDPGKTYGFVGVGVSLKDLSSSLSRATYARRSGGACIAIRRPLARAQSAAESLPSFVMHGRCPGDHPDRL
jgi:hypothetical protein